MSGPAMSGPVFL